MIIYDMNTLLKSIVLCIVLAFSGHALAQKSEYIIKDIKGSVEYKAKPTDEWQPAKRLLSLAKSALVKIADGSEMTIYSQSNPQILRIATPGENRLRTLINEAEKKAAEARGGEIAHVFKGHGAQRQAVRSGTSYRGPADKAMLMPLFDAVKAPVSGEKAPIALGLIKDSNGEYDVELANNSDTELAIAVIILIDGRYSALRISDGTGDNGIVTLPAGVKMVIPECKLVAVNGMKAIAVASQEAFSPETLCIVLNSPADKDNGPAGEGGAVAVEASVM